MATKFWTMTYNKKENGHKKTLKSRKALFMYFY